MKKIIWVSTVPLSMKLFCTGLFGALKEKWELKAVSSPDKELKEIENSQGIETREIRMKRGITPLSDFVALCRLFFLFSREKPDMVHSITPKAGLLAMAAAWLAGVKVRVHTFTGLIFPTATGIKKVCCKISDRMICRCATHIIAESQGVRQELMTFGITRKSVRMNGYGNLRGVDADYYKATDGLQAEAEAIRATMDAKPETCVILYTGRLAHDKGIDELTEAFAKIAKEGQDVRLVIAGIYDTSDPISERAARIITGHHDIYFTDRWVHDVRPYYLAADFLVLPSYREGMPNAVIEACAMGIPAIVTDVNGSREIITTGLNGIVIPARSTANLERAMSKLIEDKALRKEMARRARESVISRFEQSFVRGELVKFYEEVLK